MNRQYYYYISGVVLLLALSWLIELGCGHPAGQALILSTDSDTSSARIRAELMYIASHTVDIELPKPKAYAPALTRLHKVVIDSYTVDSVQVQQSKDITVDWWTWKARNLGVRLLSEPVLVIKGDSIYKTGP